VPYASANLESEEVVAGAIALTTGLTLQWHSDPEAIRPDLVSRILRALAGGSTVSDSAPVSPSLNERTELMVSVD
jgi:hypothetical protein